MVTLPLPDNPRVFFGNNSLQNNIVQTTNLVDRNGQNFNTSIANIARTDGGVIQNVNKSPIEITMNLGVTNSVSVSDYVFFRDRIEDLKQNLDYSERYLRVMHKNAYTVVDAPTGSTSNITLTGANNLNTSVNQPQILSHTYTFSSNASTTVVFDRTFAPVDLSAFLATSNVLNLPQFDFLINIPKIRVLNSVDVKIGTDSSNYYVYSNITTNYENLLLEQGKNILSIPFFLPDRTISPTVNFSEIGTVNKASIGYVSITFNLNETDTTNGYGYDGVIFSEDSKIRNFVCTPTGKVSIEDKIGDLVSSFPNFSFICSDGYARGTQIETILNETSVTTLSSTKDVFFYGNKTQLPTFTVKLNAVTNMSKVRIRNVVDNKILEFDEGSTPWTVNDLIVFNAESKEITRNNLPQDTTIGRIPDFDKGNQTISFDVLQGNSVSINTNAGNQVATPEALTNQGFVINPGPPTNIIYFGYSVAQSFVCTQTGTISSITFKVRKSNSNIASMSAEIVSDNAGVPSNSALPNNYAVINDVTDGSITFNFTNYGVVSGATFWVILKKLSGDNVIYIEGSNMTSTYASGKLMKREGVGTWTNSTISADAQMIVVQDPTPSTNIDYTVKYTRTYQ